MMASELRVDNKPNRTTVGLILEGKLVTNSPAGQQGGASARFQDSLSNQNVNQRDGNDPTEFADN